MKKVFKWTGIIVALLIVFLMAAPFLFKDKIISAVKTEANNNLLADFNFSSLDLSLIRSFPHLSISLNDLSIINREPFKGDTLIYSKEVVITVNLISVISGDQIEIKKILADQGVFNFLVNKEGKANWDITKPSPETETGAEASTFKASLNKYAVLNSRLTYDDRTMDFTLKVDDLNHEGKGDFTQDLFVLSTHSEAQELTMQYEGIPYLSKVRIVADADLDMNIKEMKFIFKDNKFLINDLPVLFSGWLAMPAEDIDMDLKFATEKSEFKSLLSLIPAIYSNSFNELTASGKLSFDGFVKGRYNEKQMPGYGLTVMVENGAFKYPSLPSEVKNVDMDLKIFNPDGITDHTVINLSKLHVEMAGDPFDAKLIVKTPISDPDLDAFARGKINLANISKFVPLEKGTILSGIISSDINLKGRMSAVQKQQYDQFSASGKLSVSQLEYTSASQPLSTKIDNMELVFSPKQVLLNDFMAHVGKSDFKASGSLENFIAYALKDDVLIGTLNFSSSLIDLNEFMSSGNTPSSSANDTSAMSILVIPANIDFSLNASVNQLIYQNLSIKNLAGRLIVKEQSIKMKDVLMQLMGGSLKMNGSYATVNPVSPVVDFDLGITDFNIKQTAQAFATVDKLAPIARYVDGVFSSSLNFKTNLNSKMEPVYETVSGKGSLTTKQVAVSNFEPVNKIADALKINSLKQLSAPNTNISFKIEGGRLFVEPFDVSVNGMKSTIAGSNGIDQSIDYGINTSIPRSMFGGAANAVLDNLVSKANTQGTNVSVSDQIPVDIRVGGTVMDPKITTNLSKKGASLMNDLKAQAAAEFAAKKKEAEERAKAEAERLKKDAETKINKEKEKAMSEAERIKKEAEAKAKSTADSIKKAGEKTVKDQLQQLNPFKKK